VCVCVCVCNIYVSACYLVYTSTTLWTQVDAVQRLTECKANVNFTDSEGVTSLMWACVGRVIISENSKIRDAKLETTLDHSERILCR